MNKYKLIKCYPGSPELGTEIFKWDYLNPKDERYNYNGNLGGLLLLKPKDYPEFWEPVVEKEFEILEFKYLDNNFYYEYSFVEADRHVFSSISGKFILDDTSISTVEITKIRRLSDNKIFSIGDLCYPESRPLNCGRITKFEFCKAGYFRIGCKGKYYIGINDVVKSKEPLFTTFDGKDIFEGDSYWYVDNRYYIGWVEHINAKWYFNCKSTLNKRFSTKELAQEYIDNNKPIYSKNQIDSAISKCYISTSIGTFLKEDDFKQHLNLKL